MTDLRALLAPIRERLAAATPGPWSHGEGITLYVAKRDWVEKQNQTICHDVRPKDAALIANAPTDLTRLLAAIEAVVARMEDRANMLSSTAERLAKQVMDRDPEADADADAAVRYGHYALEALSAVAQLKSALAAALGSDTTNQEGTQ